MKWEVIQMRITQWLRWRVAAAALLLGSVLSAEAQEIKFWTLTFDNPNVTKAFNRSSRISRPPSPA